MDPEVFRKKLENKGIDDLLVDAGPNIVRIKVKKSILWIAGSGIGLMNYEAKYIIKIIISLEKREISLKGTTIKITVKKESKWCTYTISKKCFGTLTITAVVSATGAAIQKKVFGSRRHSDLVKQTTLKFSYEELDDFVK